MKNTLMALAFLSACAANAQTVSTTSVLNASPAPAQVKNISSNDIRPEHFLPVLGQYKTTGNPTHSLSISVDPANMGIIWIEGMPQGKFKALLKQSPAVYKIPAQKTESGKNVAEGTLFYNKESAELKIVVGVAFNDDNPVASFNDTTPKSKAISFTALKTEVGTISQ